MRLRYKQSAEFSSTPAEEKDLGNAAVESVVDTAAEGGIMRFKVPASTTNQNIQHPQVATAAYLFLKTEAVDPTQTPAELTVKRNATGGEAWPITPVDGKQGHLQMSTSGLTALYISNPGSVDMFVTVGMAGD